MSRANYYACRRQRRARKVDEDLILSLVRGERQVHPRLGGRKLLHVLREDLEANGVRVGRDRLFDILSAHGLLVESTRPVRAPRTRVTACRSTTTWLRR